MAAHFDKILFLISTDCFTDQLFGEFGSEDIEKVKQAARNAVRGMINGGDNYFMCADYSADRIQKTQTDFFAELISKQVGLSIQQKIVLFHEALSGISEELRTAGNTIKLISARLYWLDANLLTLPITDELLNIMADVEPIGLQIESRGFEWEDVWLNSPSKWDQYVMSLMDGIDEIPYLTFLDVMKFSSQFGFLYDWKRKLGEHRFSLIREFLRAEASAELGSVNGDAVKEVGRILTAL